MKQHTKWRVASGLTAAVSLVFAFSLSAVGEEGVELSPAASQPTVTGEAAGPSEMAVKPSVSESGPGVYIVQLEAPSIATYTGGIRGYEATSRRVTGEKRLNTNSKAAKKYEKYLKSGQDAFIADCESSFGHTIDVSFQYQHVLNGVAMELSPDEAETVAGMPGVKNVSRERMEVPLTDAGPHWINAPFIWEGPPNNVPHSRGEGVVVGVLDTGTNFDHPSFADISGDGYDHSNPLGSGNYLPGSYCDTTDPSFCNDKLIGAWSFVPGDPNFPVPEADDGHGVHTASTAAGNVVPGAAIVAPTTTFVRDVSGVAPRANIIAYDVCVVSCPGSALVAAVNQVVIDSGNLPNGIAAINYSISGGSNPYSDPVELGFLAAADAGVYVSTSAGNSGPGAGTVAHLSPWVGTTGASTHNRAIVNAAIDFNSDGGGIPDIAGLGLTSGYGPAPIIDSASLEGLFPGSTLCGLGGLGSFIPPWPPGTFNGEIVACTRGTFGRVEKGANVLAAGAGGYILMDNGGGIVGDAHVLPGVHISQADGATLAAWLAANVGSTTGSISGFSLDLDPANGDVMAGFSSRGPSGAFDVLKPDVTAPGVSIMAGEDTDGVTFPPEFGFLSGTSMSSPHHAGSAALLTAVHPDWSPHQIKSALMMTSTTANTLKEDGATPTDHFDVGAGRVDLQRASEVGLTLDETTANFLAADPNLGGDPKTLNVASMQDSLCLPECSWTRTVENVTGHSARWDLSTTGPAGLDLSTDPGRKLKLKADKSAEITVHADTALAAPGWNHANLHLERKGDGPDLHMPIAVFAARSSNPDVLNKTVDADTAAEDEQVLYQIDITNGRLAGTINLSDTLPDGLDFVPGSETEVVTNGTTFSPFAHAGGTLSWSGELDQSGLAVVASPAPFGYFALSNFFAPAGFPGNCDDGGFIFSGLPAFTYNGVTHSSVIMSVNGTLEVGTASGVASSFANQNLPDPAIPNNILAPFWRDLNGCPGDGSNGNLYAGILSAGGGAFQWIIFEWEDIPFFGAPPRSTFQIWLGTDASAGGNTIHYTYNRLDDTTSGGTVGAENATGTDGDSYFFNGAGTAPAVGTDLEVVSPPGGTATFTFMAEIDDCEEDEAVINRANVSADNGSETAIAVFQCVDDDFDSDSDSDSDSGKKKKKK